MQFLCFCQEKYLIDAFLRKDLGKKKVIRRDHRQKNTHKSLIYII